MKKIRLKSLLKESTVKRVEEGELPWGGPSGDAENKTSSVKPAPKQADPVTEGEKKPLKPSTQKDKMPKPLADEKGSKKKANPQPKPKIEKPQPMGEAVEEVAEDEIVKEEMQDEDECKYEGFDFQRMFKAFRSVK